MDRKYNIVVLSDLKDATENILKSSISLAKTFGGDIKFFHVKKGTDVVDRDSQLSTFRTINEQHSLTKNSIDSIIHSVSKAYNVAIDYSYAFGNVKNEIKDYLAKQNPDIVVLGKRKTRFGVPVDSTINFVLKNFKGRVMVVGDQNILEPGETYSLGFLNNGYTGNTDAFASQLAEHAQKPFKAFRFADQTNQGENDESILDNNAVEFVFERNSNTISNLSKYVLKSKINLLYFDRRNTKAGLKHSDIKDILGKVDVSVLLSEEPNP